MAKSDFVNRHIGPTAEEVDAMLKVVGVKSAEELIQRTIPQSIRLDKDLDIPEAMSEQEYHEHIEEVAAKNREFDSYIGLGYYGCFVPSVIQRNVLENPGWYTAYTPYQAEIAQGRLEGLLNFQTMVMDLTGMEIANASLLDEGTAGAEAMQMFYSLRSRDEVKRGVNKLFLSKSLFPQTMEVIRTRAVPLGVEIVEGEPDEFKLTDEFFGAVVQYPNENGEIKEWKDFVKNAHEVGVKVAVASDLLSLTLISPPGEWGADVVFGSSQRFGVPMGFGGPHAAFFATKEDYKRNIPGRIIGVSQDAEGRPAMRMALQTREQHIRRDKATSNICTAQALLACMAGFYAIYHGPIGLKEIATEVHLKTSWLKTYAESIGFTARTDNFFDTLRLTVPEDLEQDTLRIIALGSEVNLLYFENGDVGISLDESTTVEKLCKLANVLADATNSIPLRPFEIAWKDAKWSIADHLTRKTDYLTHDVFNSYHSETKMMRYLKRLENKDISLVHSMIPLGSCTMKLNAATELEPITWPGFANIHPFAPEDQTIGYLEIINRLDRDLAEITGFSKVCLQPNSGAQGEYAGLMVIKAYHDFRGDHQRNIVLIPSSAHGTNPASAVMAGMKVVVVKCDDQGNIDVDDLRAKAEKHSENLSALMVTYPSTHGVYEEKIREVTGIVHEHGGQVYMDGANMNAQVGLTNPGQIGADVCHLNLHKTFSIPHGGGGPGVGPIGVAKHLEPFLPGNPFVDVGGEHGITAISSAPWGSALILLISYGYIKMLGSEGLKRSTEMAILGANYLKAKIENDYPVLYTGANNTVAHEMIIDCRAFKKSSGIEVEDIAKRLMDYGFHAPTVSFPVAGTLMVEPTESEGQEELDRFVEAMTSIRSEIRKIENGEYPRDNNPLKNAPHTASRVMVADWQMPYSREEAVFPVDFVRDAKVWPSVSRVDNAHGDRNLICSCPSIDSYEEEEAVVA